MTDPLGQSQVIPYLSALTRYGYEFTILSCDKPVKYEKQKDYVRKILEPYPIEWISIPYHKNPPVLSSIYDYYSLRKTAKKLHRLRKFDMVHTRPGIPTLVALYLKKKFGIKFLNDVRGFWPDERVDGGMWNVKNPLFKTIYTFFKNHDYECLQKAEGVTCLTYAARKEMHTWSNIPNQPVPITVIPCSVDLELFDPEHIDDSLKEQLRAELGIKQDDIIISYLGSIGGWYLTGEMMRFCRLLSEKIPNARFLFISPHPPAIISAVANEFGLHSSKLIVREGRRHEVPALLSFSRYSLFFIKPCYSKISSSPTKHGEIMAMGIPVITNSGVGDVAEIVEKYKAGYVIRDFSEASFQDVISSIRAGNTFDQNDIRDGAKEFYSLANAVEKYKSVYERVLGQ